MIAQLRLNIGKCKYANFIKFIQGSFINVFA